MSIVERLRALIKARGGDPTGVMTIEEGVRKLEQMEEDANPLSALAIDVDIDPAENLLGKVVGDLQKDVSVGVRGVTGELYYVDDYTGFSGDPALQSGWYLVTHAAVPDVTGVTIKFHKSNRAEVKSLDSDGLMIARFEENEILADNVSITWTAYKDGYAPFSKTLSMAKLILDPEDDE